MGLLYPLRFQPLLRRYIWGGRRLETLGKTLGPESDYAESWEIADHGDDQSIVAFGPLTGRSLGRLTREHAQELLDKHASRPRFPLLFKFLDAHDRLSIQVHPDNPRAALLDPPQLGKTEAWVILEADPGSYLYAGLRRGIDRDTLAREVVRHTCELCLRRIEPAVGDCYFLPSGVVHALGPGLVVAEIQQASDITYRLYDWGRPGPDGRPRTLHVEEALAAIDFQYGPVAAAQAEPTGDPTVERLVHCDEFVLDRWRLSGMHQAAGDQRCHIMAVLSGEVEIAGDPAGAPLVKGGVVLLPAELGPTAIQARGEAVLLDAYLP
jgi:mannose-6-phosphate isomerase